MLNAIVLGVVIHTLNIATLKINKMKTLEMIKSFITLATGLITQLLIIDDTTEL